MPNHVHVLVIQRQGFPLAEIVKSWKAFTARQANARTWSAGQFSRWGPPTGIARERETRTNNADLRPVLPVGAGTAARSAAKGM